MARTTAEKVRAVLNRDYDSRREPSLTPYIEAASALVDDAAAADTSLSSSRLEKVERWLAAHFYKVSDKPYLEKWTGDAKAKYDGATGKYLEATLYGQTAVALDTSGYLAGLAQGGLRRQAGTAWLGKTFRQQTDYEDR